MLPAFCVLRAPGVTGFCGNVILKIAPTAHCCRNFSRLKPTPAAWLIHCSLSSHSHFIILYARAPLCYRTSDGCVGGGEEATTKLRRNHAVIGWWDPFNLLPLLEGPPPSSSSPSVSASTHKPCAASVPERLSALHREERISSTTHLICIYVLREQHEHPRLRLLCIKTWHSNHYASLHLLSLLGEDSGTGVLLFFTFLYIYFRDFDYLQALLNILH